MDGRPPGPIRLDNDVVFEDFLAAFDMGRMGDARRGLGIHVPHRNGPLADGLDAFIGVVETPAGRPPHGLNARRGRVMGALDEFGVLHP